MRFGLVKSAVLAFAFAIAFPAYASVIAIFGNPGGNNAVDKFLASNGYTVEFQPTELVGVDVVILLRTDGNADVEKFVLGGGLLITEFSSARWVLNQTTLLEGEAGSAAQFFQGNAPVTLTPRGRGVGLGKNLTNPFTFGPATIAQWELLQFAQDELLGTRPGSVIPTMLGGASGDGFALVNALAWSEPFSTNDPGDAGQWLLNAVNVDQAAPVPEPGSLALAGLALACLAFTRRRRILA